MKQILRDYPEIKSIALLPIISVSFIIFRMAYTQSIFLGFLLWNLFLAAIPWLLTYFILKRKKLKSLSFILLTALVILFLPNAAYILTDLFHLRLSMSAMPIWYDTLTILMAALSGLLFFYLVVFDLRNIWMQKNRTVSAELFIAIIMFSSSFGIYIGRYLRFNSWDIISNPTALFQEIMIRLVYPFDHPRTWGMTFGWGLLLYSGYYVLKNLNIKNQINPANSPSG